MRGRVGIGAVFLLVSSMVVGLDIGAARGAEGGVAGVAGQSGAARVFTPQDLASIVPTASPEVPERMPLPEGSGPHIGPVVVEDHPAVEFAPTEPGPIIEAAPAEHREFEALDGTGWDPPDTNGAVGPNEVMTALNGGVIIHDRSGANPSTEVSLSAWFGRAAQNDVFDPVTLYDRFEDRWIMVATASSSDADSAVLLATSDTHDPRGSWHSWTIDADASPTGLWADRPFVGVNDRWITVSLNMFDIPDDGVSNSTRPQIYVFPKDEAYDLDTWLDWSVWTTQIAGSNYRMSMVPAESYDSGVTTSYLVGSQSAADGQIKLWAITGAADSPTIDTGTLIDSTASWAWEGGELGEQKDSTAKVDLGDARMQKVILRDGEVWATHSIFLPAGTPTYGAVQIWHLETDGTILRRQVLANSSESRAYPSVAVNDLGHILVGYAIFQDDEHPGAAYAYSTNGIDWELKYFRTGLSTYLSLVRGVNRWGDYTATVVDPLNDVDMWTIGQYSDSTPNTWSTWWAMVKEGPDYDELVDGNTASSLPTIFFGNNTNAGPLYLGATDEPLTCGASVMARTLWYSYTPPADVRLKVETINTGFDTVVGVYTGNREEALTFVGCDDDDGPGNQSLFEFDADGGTTYRFQVGGWHGVSGSMQLRLSEVPPGNDDFSGTWVVGSVPYSNSQTTAGATTESGEPLTCGPAAFGKTVWYRWTAPSDGVATIATVGSGFDTVMGVYTGSSVGGLTSVDCNDDNGIDGNRARVVFSATAGTTYRIQIGGYGAGTAQSGALTVGVTFTVDTQAPVVTPPDDVVAAATDLSGAAVAYGLATAIDNVGVVWGPSCSPVSGSWFAVGDTTVTCEAGDAAGNVGSADFTVTVLAMERYAGDNRYETAAAISAGDFTDPAAVDTVFVAVGTNFPDALAGAAAAGMMDAPLVLAAPNAVPAAIASEVARLAPDTVVMLGGSDVLSDSVMDALGTYAATSIRLEGPNRYSTAVAVSQWAHPSPPGGGFVFVATGLNFPDALAGAAVAGAMDSPLLLVPGGSVPSVVEAEVARLSPGTVVMLGGPDVVSDGVMATLGAYATHAVRLEGPNRYSTAVAISSWAFAPGVRRAYVATGSNFPDALAGAAAAGMFESPVLLVPGTAVPTEVAAEITRLDPAIVILLGGSDVVSSAVANTIGTLLGL